MIKGKFKTIMFMITALALVLVVSGCSKKDESKETEVDSGPTTPITKNYVKPNEITKKFEDGESFAFAIVDKDCSACQLYKKDTLIKFEEDKVGDIKLIEINKIDSREKDLMDLTDLIQIYLQGKFEATPTTYFVKEGQLVEVVVGAIDIEELTAFYNKYLGDENTEEKKSDKDEEASEENVEKSGSEDETKNPDAEEKAEETK